MDSIGLLFMGGMLAVMWLFFIRPQQKQQKLAKEFQDGIDKGVRVVTSSGIHGKVLKADQTTVLLEVDNNTKIRVERSHVHLEMTKAAYPDDKKPEPTEPSK